MATDLQTILPELILAVYAMLALVGAVYTGKDNLTGPITLEMKEGVAIRRLFHQHSIQAIRRKNAFHHTAATAVDPST